MAPLVLAFALAAVLCAEAASSEPLRLEQWRAPPMETRPVARWWWPGGSVEPDALREQLGRLARAGFGAVELQPLLLGLGDSDLAADPRIRTVGRSSFTASVAVAAKAAEELGLGFDLTLGSGWPSGLPTAKENAERQLLMGSFDVEGPKHFSGPLPAVPEESERRAVSWLLDILGPVDPELRVVAVLAGRLGEERDGVPTLHDLRLLPEAVAKGHLDWTAPAGRWRIFCFYENTTGHFVMGGAYPGEAFDARVVDHLSRQGADALLAGYAAPIVEALGPGQLRELFVDSFELVGELPTTHDLLEAFQARFGYSLTPHLPLVFRKGGESKFGKMLDVLGRNGGPLYRSVTPETDARVREDYEALRSELFAERFVEGIRAWAHRHEIALRLQAHGGYADYLDTYARADVPESEGLFGGGSFDFLKLAASAAHVTGRPWASSESFVRLRLFGTRLSIDEMRLLAGRAYSAGINRLVFHGVPYRYERADGKPWYPFSGGFGRVLAGPLPISSEIDPPFLDQLADFNRFVARMTLAMSRGRPAAEVAWLRANPGFPDEGSLQLGRTKAHDGESATTRSLRARGLVHDRVSRRMLTAAVANGDEARIGAGRYRAVLLDPLEVAKPELVEAVAALAEAGVPVLALGALPKRAPGLRDAEQRDRRVRAAARRLEASVVVADEPDRLETVLAETIRNDLVEPPPGARLAVSLERRRSGAEELLLVVNESWSPRRAVLRFTRAGGALTRWDPRLGSRTRLRDEVAPGDAISLALAAAESLILTLAPAPRGVEAESDSIGRPGALGGKLQSPSDAKRAAGGLNSRESK